MEREKVNFRDNSRGIVGVLQSVENFQMLIICLIVSILLNVCTVYLLSHLNC